MRETSVAHMFKGTLPQLIAVVTGTVSAISDGMQYGWSAPLIPVLQSPDSPVKITETDAVWLENIYMIGGMAGLPITIYCVDRIGRQKTIIGACITNLIAWIIIAVGNSVEYLLLARFLTGLAGDVNFVAAPMYIAEIADQKIRGFLAGIIYLMMLLGILVIYSVGPFVPVYASSVVGMGLLIFELLTYPFMPESPYYLLGKGKYEAAQKSLRRLRGTMDVDKELQEISKAVERQRSERGRPQDLILIKSNRKALLIMSVLNAAQHLSSISVILMNLHKILEAAGSIYMSSQVAAIIFAAAMLISASSASFIIDKYGRKILLTSSSLLTGLSLLVIAIYFQLQNSGVDVASVSWIPIASVMVYAAVFKFGLGMVPIVMTAELFPAKVKAMGMTLSDLMYLLFGLISIEMYHVLSEAYGIQVPFFIFAASCLLTAAFCAFVIPETKGKTLEEIQFILKGEPYEPPHVVENGKSSEIVDSKISDCTHL
ncbi:facilitated trehalose transporter Tret1 isoform X1 [Tribolium castaneum]|uniref:Facilitated trehalose transporter Tret1-2 homolog-like Protein n=2 Tax=Tribolium castaneum TaxID=7070 RepID=D6X0L6_TRICA|nr:PREDICTED: facilitated trehalose transporter Tret1 isoform X1 [Tribolium castaneum]XP_008197581.1 PREDICTED: facilitated trehalose transporter Tret1 isoform X1 [Tribolium castaneum]XP_015838849.1 PREDICTED: facilitated trehalose transporter Tret1 isoform X1 [Tribolium castaneum]XP_972686.1 PREDICTED: facilitated trehalose transporter Tret1 isoform X1 [Tribolium castaneum]EFA10110.1 Facilitated trehalose transporter Tret1-2 homolog-like Protein [Tribolium castaneum]|eukprot:XP_008197580.1 PREDICTED: facilitated trehalose transporter Tret1 isoform X1 [Tribolium castaneum]